MQRLISRNTQDENQQLPFNKTNKLTIIESNIGVMERARLCFSQLLPLKSCLKPDPQSVSADTQMRSTLYHDKKLQKLAKLQDHRELQDFFKCSFSIHRQALQQALYSACIQNKFLNAYILIKHGATLNNTDLLDNALRKRNEFLANFLLGYSVPCSAKNLVVATRNSSLSLFESVLKNANLNGVCLKEKDFEPILHFLPAKPKFRSENYNSSYCFRQYKKPVCFSEAGVARLQGQFIEDIVDTSSDRNNPRFLSITPAHLRLLELAEKRFLKKQELLHKKISILVNKANISDIRGRYDLVEKAISHTSVPIVSSLIHRGCLKNISSIAQDELSNKLALLVPTRESWNVTNQVNNALNSVTADNDDFYSRRRFW